MYDHLSGIKPMPAWYAQGYAQGYVLADRQQKDGRIVFDKRRWTLVCLSLMLIAISQSTLAALLAPPHTFSYTPSLSKRAANESSLLECLQVAAPISNPTGACQQVLMVHTFAFSYGHPFVGKLIHAQNKVKTTNAYMRLAEPSAPSGACSMWQTSLM